MIRLHLNIFSVDINNLTDRRGQVNTVLTTYTLSKNRTQLQIYRWNLPFCLWEKTFDWWDYQFGTSKTWFPCLAAVSV